MTKNRNEQFYKIKKEFNVDFERIGKQFYTVDSSSRILCYEVMMESGYDTTITKFLQEEFEGYICFYSYLIKKYASKKDDIYKMYYNETEELNKMQQAMVDSEVFDYFNLPNDSLFMIAHTLKSIKITKTVNSTSCHVHIEDCKDRTVEEDLALLDKLKRHLMFFKLDGIKYSLDCRHGNYSIELEQEIIAGFKEINKIFGCIKREDSISTIDRRMNAYIDYLQNYPQLKLIFTEYL